MDPRFLHADSEDTDQTGDAKDDLSLGWVYTHFVCFVMRRLIYNWHQVESKLKKNIVLFPETLQPYVFGAYSKKMFWTLENFFLFLEDF